MAKHKADAWAQPKRPGPYFLPLPGVVDSSGCPPRPHDLEGALLDLVVSPMNMAAALGMAL